MAGPSNQHLLTEIVRCGKDPAYFLKKYVKVHTTNHGMVPFETYPFQDECLQAFKDHRKNIVLKARQLGLSTITAAYCMWLALFYRDKNILVIATKQSTADEFTRKIKLMLQSIPKQLVLVPYTITKHEIKFSNGSSIVAVPTSDDAGRSTSLSLLVIDEAAHIRNFEEIWTGLAPTLSTGGSAIILSTPNGVGGQYYKLWTDAESDLNGFNPIKLMWYVHPQHDQAWFDKETRSMSKKKVAQEYHCSFEGSGDTFIQTEDMEHLYSMVLEAEKDATIDRHFWVWDKPQADRRYVISGDVSRGNGADYSGCHVIDMETFEVAAEWLGKLPPDKFGELLYKIGERYNFGLLAVENNTYGAWCLDRLEKMNYPRLLYQTSKGDIYDYKPEKEDEKPGFSTQGASRQAILVKLEECLRNKRLKTYSSRTFDQLRTFVYKNNKAMAMRDAHDDLVISLAIGAYIVSDYVQIPTEEKDTSIDKAILEATSKGSRMANDVLPDISTTSGSRIHMNNVNPLGQNNPDRMRGLPNMNFDWLLK